MKKILTRLSLAVFLIQACIVYTPYSAHAVDTQTALMCRTAKLAMRTQVDNLNRSRTTAWANHWKQYSQLLVSSFSTSVAAQRLSIVKSMWTNVNAIQKTYAPMDLTVPSRGGKGGDGEEVGGAISNQTQLISPTISQIQSALSAGTTSLIALSDNADLASWRTAFLALVSTQKDNYLQTIDAVVSYNNTYAAQCGNEALPTKDSTDQASMNYMANATVSLSNVTQSTSGTTGTTKLPLCPADSQIKNVYAADDTREITNMWRDYKASFSKGLNDYFNATEVQNKLAAANTTPLAVMRNVVSVAEKAQKTYFQSIAAKKNEADAREIFVRSVYDSPKKYIVSILGDDVVRQERYSKFISYWQTTKERYITRLFDANARNVEYGKGHSCTPVTLGDDPSHVIIAAAFADITITPSDSTLTCASRTTYLNDYNNSTQNATQVVSTFVKKVSLNGMFEPNTFRERQNIANKYEQITKEYEKEYINRSNSMDQNYLSVKIEDIQKQQLEDGPDLGISVSDVVGKVMNIYKEYAAGMKSYLSRVEQTKENQSTRRDSAKVFEAFENVLNSSLYDLSVAREQYRASLKNVYTYNNYATKYKCALIPVPKSDPLNVILFKPLLSAVDAQQTFGIQTSTTQSNASSDADVKSECLKAANELVTTQNKILTSNKLKRYSLISSLFASNIFDVNTKQTRKAIALNYLAYMRGFRKDFIADYQNKADNSLVDAYSNQLADAMTRTFDVMDNYIIDSNNLSDWTTFKQNAKSVTQETKKNFAQVVAAYVDFNTQYAGKCLPMQPPLQDTIDTSFASFYQK